MNGLIQLIIQINCGELLLQSSSLNGRLKEAGRVAKTGFINFMKTNNPTSADSIKFLYGIIRFHSNSAGSPRWSGETRDFEGTLEK